MSENIELEAKFWAQAGSRAVLQARFAVRKTAQQNDIYYIMNERREDGLHYMRLREDKKTETFMLGYYIVQDDFVTREIETAVEDKNNTRSILAFLGLKPICTIDKDRMVFDAGRFEIMHDIVVDLGEFIEVEACDPTVTRDELMAFAATLGLLEAHRVIDAGYPDLLMAKKET